MALLLKPGSVKAVSGESSSTVIFFMIIGFRLEHWLALGTYLAPRFPLPENALVFTAYECWLEGFR